MRNLVVVAALVGVAIAMSPACVGGAVLDYAEPDWHGPAGCAGRDPVGERRAGLVQQWACLIDCVSGWA